MLEISVKIIKAIEELTNNYSDLGSKLLEATAKIDQDILNDVAQIDRQFKNTYPKFLAESIKPRQGPTSL